MAKRTDDKGRILRTGEQQRSADGRYLYRYTDIIGNRKTIYALTLQELREKEKELQRDLDDHMDIAGGEMTLNQLFDLFMDTKSNIKQSTRSEYLSLWKNEVRDTELGSMKIKNIKSAHIRKLYAGYTAKGYCAGTIKGLHQLISSALSMAVDSDMIRKNPAKNCGKTISGDKHKREALTRAEQNELMDYIKSEDRYKRYVSLISFLLNTGLRISECAGLEWKDVDMKNNVIHVRRQLLYRNYGDGCKYHLGSLKTAAAERDVPLTQDARKALIERKELDLKQGIKRQEVEGIDDLCFVNKNGMPIHSTAVDLQLERIVERHNQNSKTVQLPRISAHLLRHTFASRAIEAGMDAKTLQIILGHTDISVTMNVYVQMDNKEVRKKFHEVEQAMKIG